MTSWRRTRHCPAPIAARSANSRERLIARAKRRFPTLAHDQQKEADSGEKHHQEWLDVADEIVPQGNQLDAGLFVSHRKGGRQVARHHIHAGLYLGQRNAGFEPADGMRADRNPAIAKRRVVPLAYGSVDVPVAAVERETGGNYAHHGVRHAVECEGLTDDIGRGAEFARPQAAAENDHWACAHLVVIEAERVAKNGPHPERGKETRGDHVAAEPFCFGRPGEVVILVPVNGQGREAPAVALPVEEIEIDDGAAVHSGRACVEGHKLFGMRIWQRIQQYAVQDRKERRVGADAQRESENGNGGEARRLSEEPDRIMQIPRQYRHGPILRCCPQVACQRRGWFRACPCRRSWNTAVTEPASGGACPSSGV